MAKPGCESCLNERDRLSACRKICNMITSDIVHHLRSNVEKILEIFKLKLVPKWICFVDFHAPTERSSPRHRRCGDG